MTKTSENLADAFAGESQANRKYLAFAKKAEQEGYAHIARLFRAIAAAETVHALNHFNIMGGVGTTQDNLKAAFSGENYEVTTMYPKMIAEAEAEGQKKAKNSFNWAFQAEKIHEALYKYALEHMDPNEEVVEIYVCPVCGFTHIGKFDGEKCPVCSTPAEKFMKIE